MEEWRQHLRPYHPNRVSSKVKYTMSLHVLMYTQSLHNTRLDLQCLSCPFVWRNACAIALDTPTSGLLEAYCKWCVWSIVFKACLCSFAAMNEMTWQSVVQWERLHNYTSSAGPRLSRFIGRPHDFSPKARIHMMTGGEAPFDRHDWFIDRNGKEVRYVIDFYFDESKAGRCVTVSKIIPSNERREGTSWMWSKSWSFFSDFLHMYSNLLGYTFTGFCDCSEHSNTNWA